MVSYTISEFKEFKKKNEIELDELEDYLKDIIDSIEEELSTNQTNFKNNFNNDNNWRTRKNPKFMEKYSKEDKVILEINGNLNKITKKNYDQIYNQVLLKLKEKKEEDISFLLESIYNNILTNAFHQSIFAEFYLKFLIKLKSNYSILNNYFKNSIDIFLETLNELDYENIQLSKFKNNTNVYKNYGILLGYYFRENLLNYKSLIIPLINHIKNIQALLEWTPIDIWKLELNINIFAGFMETSSDLLWNQMDRDSQQDFRCQIKNIMHNKVIPIKLKFAIQEIDDRIDTNIQTKIKKNINLKKNKYINPNPNPNPKHKNNYSKNGKFY